MKLRVLLVGHTVEIGIFRKFDGVRRANAFAVIADAARRKIGTDRNAGGSPAGQRHNLLHAPFAVGGRTDTLSFAVIAQGSGKQFRCTCRVAIDKNFDPTAKPGKNVIIVTFVCTIVAFLIAQLGLNKIVSVGYKYLGYLTIPVIMIPYVVHMVATKFDTVESK